MQITTQRLRIINLFRIHKKTMSAREVANLIGESRRRVYDCMVKMEAHGAINVARQSVPFQYKITPQAYIMIGSFPPKGEVI